MSTEDHKAKAARAQLVLVRADMASIHRGLVESDMIPALRNKIADWVRGTDAAADYLASLAARGETDG